MSADFTRIYEYNQRKKNGCKAVRILFETIIDVGDKWMLMTLCRRQLLVPDANVIR